MKFIHIADMHFDSPFVNLADKENLGEKRRLEQRKIFKKIIEYIKTNNIEYLFISGDLYEHKYIKKTTIEYINNLFKEISNTKIFISPGNHDPYLKNSYYNKFNWNENVKIFKNKIEKIETEKANIYGFGFDDFYCTECGIENIEIAEKNKLNILIIHGTLNGASIEEKQYNSIKSQILEEKGFDYVALGHIHKIDYNTYENQRIVYPGSTASLGFDELGQHGMIVGELEKEKIKLEFIPVDETEFKIENLDITEIISKEELIEKINELKFEENNLIEIYLIGKRNFEIDTYEIKKYITNPQIIKIKNKTKINNNLEKISQENTLRGIFVKKMLEKINMAESEEEKNILENSIEIGLQALN